MVYVALKTVTTALTMQAWPSVPATLQQVELVGGTRGSKRASATYTYSINGQQFTGRRVSLYGADNVGGFQIRADEELRGYLARNEPYPAHVNPKDPRQSILMPVLRWEIVAFDLIFVAIFGGAGWGLLISTYLSYRRIRIEKALALQYPGEPWRQRMEWSANRIQSNENPAAIGALAGAIFFNACSWPMLFAIPEKLRAGEYLGLLFAVFPVIGIGLLYWAGVTVARARRFGRTYLVLDTFPARPGEPMRGRMYAPAALAGSQEAKLTLTCERNYRGSGTETETVWEQKAASQVLAGQSQSGEVILNVDFLIPDSLPGRSSRSPEAWFTWQLSATAVLAGADFEAEFEVPVFSR